MFSTEIRFNSPERTQFKDLTPHIKRVVEQTQTESGIVIISSRHTTMRIMVGELDEHKLLEDLTQFSLRLVPEDARSTWVDEAYKAKYPIDETFLHNCMDNPRRPVDEIDKDHNAARHIRALLFGNNSEVVDIQNGTLGLGRYQQIAAVEFDGRDGSGENPLRRRVAHVRIIPTTNHVLHPVELP